MDSRSEETRRLLDDSTDSSSISECSTPAASCSNIPSISDFKANQLPMTSAAVASAAMGIEIDLKEREWIKMGSVKDLLYYPLDSGPAFRCTKMKCTIDGIIDVTGEPDGNHFRDRCLIAYKEPHEAVLNPEIVIINPNKHEQEISNLLQAHENAKRSKPITYLGTEISIREFSNKDEIFQGMFPSSTSAEPIKIGYISPRDRTSSLVNARRSKLENSENQIEGFLGNFSHYTLVNITSVDNLKTSFQTYLSSNNYRDQNANISYHCFSPNIVIEGSAVPPYYEDSQNIEFVKIGKVVFHKIIPCVHDDRINYNRQDREHPFLRLHAYLHHLRKLPKSDVKPPYERPDMAMFGINMERITYRSDQAVDDVINIDDEVFVSFKPDPL